ncbi:hypothetical protein BDV59DRAFT_205428 [Aspergillus ambiguus]|uniref:DUF3723 domain-containing protein n=1 Tax=Aspergillus ambiguus TaxID=176160 RepID=UPI003CCCEAFD
MQRALFTEEEVRLAAERRLKYLGTAKVHINQIQFDPPLPRDLDPKNLNRLREIFRKNRCRRLDVDNHVPAIVSQHDLSLTLQKANVPRRLLLTNDPQHFPLLGFSVGQLRALHGRHRVQAGAEMLPPADRWWTVDLYSDDLGDGLKTSLVDEYANQKKPTDGEIYRKIRQYELEDNEAFRQRWFVRLSPSNQDRLDQLDNKRNRCLRRAFDRLLAIPGLWLHGMRISMLHRLIATGCVEEILAYLGHIRDFWSSLVTSDPSALKKIDTDTVDALQLMAPGKCRTDAKMARGLVLGGQVLAGFNDQERQIIWDNMQNFDGLIPSLYTFFEDFKYLESCSHCVKRLIGPSTNSVWQSMSSIFIPSEEGESVIQTSESTFRSERGSDRERLDKGYLQMWLYAMRHYPLMPPNPKNDDDLLAKPARGRADDRVIHEMAELARRLGFDSPEIRALSGVSPDHQIARAALLQARKPGRFRYDPQQFDTLVQRVVECFAAAVPEEPGEVHELLADSSVSARARCGMPRMRTHKQDSLLLFLDRLHADIEVADTITTFFVRRCVYFAFFGKPERSGPAEVGHTGPPDIPPGSPLFVGGNQLVPHTIHHSHERELLGRSPETRANRERRTFQRRRTRMIRRRLQRPAVDQEPMEIERLGTEATDEDMSDQDSLAWEPAEGQAAAPQTEPITISSALVPAGSEGSNIIASAPEDREHTSPPERRDSSNPPQSGPDDANASSQCTRISVEAVPITRDSVQSPPTADLEQQGSGDTTRSYLSAYIDKLHRAVKEQEELEERLDRERLEEELNLSREEPPSLELVSASQRQQTLTIGAYGDEGADVAAQPHQEGSEINESSRVASSPPRRGDSSNPSHSARADDIPQVGETHPPSGHVQITFWNYEREEFKLSDLLQVDPSDPSQVERVAKKYIWKSYRLYDKNMKSLGPAQCYRAATLDGSNAIFIISEHEQEKLAADGRFVNDERMLSLASRVLDESEPATPVKRLRHHSVSSERLRHHSVASEEL